MLRGQAGLHPNQIGRTNKMKSNWKAIGGVLLALSFLAAACGSDGGGSEAGSCEVGQVDGDLALYNWAEYIDEEQLDEFAAEYEIGATMDSYESNEVLQPKIAAGNSGYDVIVPSDYMVASSSPASMSRR